MKVYKIRNQYNQLFRLHDIASFKFLRIRSIYDMM